MDKTAYLYDETTKEYLDEIWAQENPMEPGTWLQPANSTYTAPPEAQTGYARVWGTDAWSQVEDHRGATIWSDWQTCKEMKELGPVPEGWSLTKPDKPESVSDLKRELEQKQQAVCDAGITCKTNDGDWSMDTGRESLAKIQNQVIVFNTTSAASVQWIVTCQDKGCEGDTMTVTISKADFLSIFSFINGIGISAMGVQSTYSIEAQEMTEVELKDKTHMADFRARYAAAFAGISRTLDLRSA